MAFHVLGALTLVAQAGVAGYVARYLWHAGRYPWSWQRPLPVPKYAKGPVFNPGSGADYVGMV